MEVSVVIPVFNGYKWAKDIATSLQGNISYIKEVILINDGEKYDFEKLVTYLKENVKVSFLLLHTIGKQGPAVARNMGIDKSNGNYIAFLDCDDVWLQGSLISRVNLLKCNPRAAFSYCSWEYITEYGKGLNPYILPEITTFEKLIVTNYLALPSIVIKREILIDLRFPIVGHEDFAFLLSLLSLSEFEAVGSKLIGIQVRKVSGSLSSNKKKVWIWHWQVLRRFKIPFLISILLFFAYVVNAILKRKFRFQKPLFFNLDKLVKFWSLTNRNVLK
jgi:teichuronic acid biosynthesis glycosyltransferase TuaG